MLQEVIHWYLQQGHVHPDTGISESNKTILNSIVNDTISERLPSPFILLLFKFFVQNSCRWPNRFEVEDGSCFFHCYRV